MVDKGTLALVIEIIEVVLETTPSPVHIIPHESRHFQNSNALKLGATRHRRPVAQRLMRTGLIVEADQLSDLG
jgi:hypothetical protein